MAEAYGVRPVTAADAPLLARWRAAPHVARWWGPEEREDPRVRAWIVGLGGRPFAFIQDYGVHDEPGHHFAHLPPGSRGIDQFIGEAEMTGKGHGPALMRAHALRLFAEGAPAVGTDPHPDNRASRRAAEKAGFRLTGGPVGTPWGVVVLMEAWAGLPPGAG